MMRILTSILWVRVLFWANTDRAELILFNKIHTAKFSFYLLTRTERFSGFVAYKYRVLIYIIVVLKARSSYDTFI